MQAITRLRSAEEVFFRRKPVPFELPLGEREPCDGLRARPVDRPPGEWDRDRGLRPRKEGLLERLREGEEEEFRLEGAGTALKLLLRSEL